MLCVALVRTLVLASLVCRCASQALRSASSDPYGIRSGSNRISWPNGCCEGDLIVIDFRDEQADGNAGTGMLYINNTAAVPNTIEHYRIDGDLGYMWKSYGPFCAYEGWHNMSYTSDANPDETTFTITDSFGLIKAKGGMDAFPIKFHTQKPSKFCTPDGGLDEVQRRQRNRKLIAANDQFTPRERLEKQGWAVPQDVWPPLTVYNNNGTHIDRAIERRKNPLTSEYDGVAGGVSGPGNGGNLY
jgi:hypothetical protein